MDSIEKLLQAAESVYVLLVSSGCFLRAQDASGFLHCQHAREGAFCSDPVDRVEV